MIGDTYLLPLTVFFLLLAVATLAWKARRRRGYRPFMLGAAGAITIVAGKFYLENDFMGYAGIFLLVAASVWNAFPGKGAAGAILHPRPDDDRHR